MMDELINLFEGKINNSNEKVHQLSNEMKEWEVTRLHPDALLKSSQKNKIRFVCMSDTHSMTSKIGFKIPNGDVFLHAGDFTRTGRKSEVVKFNFWLGTLPHKHKIVIAGNHELSFDFRLVGRRKSGSSGQENDHTEIVSLLTNAHYLQDESVVINGIKIYGSPWQPEHLNWAFTLPRGEPCRDKWNLIPDNTDILLTHTPPSGHGDLCRKGKRVGCADLLSSVQQRIKPRFHVFGHIHEDYGVTTDGETVFINAATCNRHYYPTNAPIVFDYLIPQKGSECYSV